jgi:hypothetical protein
MKMIKLKTGLPVLMIENPPILFVTNVKKVEVNVLEAKKVYFITFDFFVDL